MVLNADEADKERKDKSSQSCKIIKNIEERGCSDRGETYLNSLFRFPVFIRIRNME